MSAPISRLEDVSEWDILHPAAVYGPCRTGQMSIVPGRESPSAGRAQGTACQEPERPAPLPRVKPPRSGSVWSGPVARAGCECGAGPDTWWQRRAGSAAEGAAGRAGCRAGGRGLRGELLLRRRPWHAGVPGLEEVIWEGWTLREARVRLQMPRRWPGFLKPTL